MPLCCAWHHLPKQLAYLSCRPCQRSSASEAAIPTKTRPPYSITLMSTFFLACDPACPPAILPAGIQSATVHMPGATYPKNSQRSSRPLASVRAASEAATPTKTHPICPQGTIQSARVVLDHGQLTVTLPASEPLLLRRSSRTYTILKGRRCEAS